MPKDNLYDIHEYRRRRAFRLNKPSSEVDNPDIRLEARMEMMENRIAKLENDPVRCGRVSINGVDLWSEMILVRKHSRESLISVLDNSNEADWCAQPNRFLAIIARVRKLKPLSTKP